MSEKWLFALEYTRPGRGGCPWRWLYGQDPLTEAAKNMGPFAQCLALNQHVDRRKAVRLLGWPRLGGFVDEVHIFYASWKAAQQA